ncbi:MAG: cysteine desulfurase [Methylococcaceae bacterium]|nr:cysteine desulfurase [Methylococcaceae bacterium]MCI0733750.1 cysteine desulfurase [Methylococcaceae bacterium]
MIYFDYNATSPLKSGVLDAMLPYYRDFYGNPSSLHRIGRIARDAVENAREQVAALAGAEPSRILFTSGGTEANNLAIRGLAESLPRGRILVSPIEHPSVTELVKALARQGWPVATLGVDDRGVVREESIEAALRTDVCFASCMIANNETGVIQNIRGIADRLRARNIPIHCDGVQALAKIPLDFNALGVSFLSLSAHKIGGPKGIGALVIDKSLRLEPLLRGGGQEKGLRGGTENVAAIVGFGAAAEIARNDLKKNTEALVLLKQKLERGLKKLRGATIFSESAERLPNTLMFGVPGVEGEMMVMELDRKGIAVSSGSACSSQSTEPSHVLLAMGVPAELASCAVRISLGPENSEAEIDRFLSTLYRILPSERVTAAAR